MFRWLVGVEAHMAEVSLLRVVVEIGGRRYDEDLASQASIAPNIGDLNDGLAKNPGRYAEWATLEALAREVYDTLGGEIEKLDSDIKEREARAYLEIVTPPPAAPAAWKPVYTVDGVKAAVVVDEQRLELVRRRNELAAARVGAKVALDKVAVGRKTIEMKADSLMTLSTNWRQEMQTQLTVSSRQSLPGPLPGR